MLSESDPSVDALAGWLATSPTRAITKTSVVDPKASRAGFGSYVASGTFQASDDVDCETIAHCWRRSVPSMHYYDATRIDDMDRDAADYAWRTIGFRS